MSRCNPIIWYDNIPIDEELLSDTIENVLLGDQETRGGDKYYTSYFINSSNRSGPDTIFREYYNSILIRVLSDLGLHHRSQYSVGTWMQVYNNGHNMRVHDHYHGGELVSFVHFVQPTDTKVFYFINSNGDKIYPDEQRKDDFIVFPPWLEHGVDVNNSDTNRAIISGNVNYDILYRNEFNDYSKAYYNQRLDGGQMILIDSGGNNKPKQRHSELDSL